MKYIILVLAFIALLVVPQLSYAGCQTITIMQDGQFKTCIICTSGSMTTVNCM